MVDSVSGDVHIRCALTGGKIRHTRAKRWLALLLIAAVTLLVSGKRRARLRSLHRPAVSLGLRRISMRNDELLRKQKLGALESRLVMRDGMRDLFVELPYLPTQYIRNRRWMQDNDRILMEVYIPTGRAARPIIRIVLDFYRGIMRPAPRPFSSTDGRRPPV